MGNILWSRRISTTTKVMKITGETQIFKTPIQAQNILKNHPHHLLFESDEVKLLGIQAQPLELQHNLSPERLYFLVEIPENFSYSKRLVESAAVSTAEARLERLKQRRRKGSGEGLEDGVLRVRFRVRKAEVEKLVRECKDESAVAEKLLGLFMAASRRCTQNGGRIRRLPAGAGAGEQKRVSFLAMKEREEKSNILFLFNAA